MVAPIPLPLYLFQVLEKEYAALHGEVLPSWNWRFDPSHIRDAASLLTKLGLTAAGEAVANNQPADQAEAETASSATVDPDRLAAIKLREYLRRKFEENPARVARLRAAPDPAVLAEALNRVLEDPDLFKEERFSHYWLNTSTRNLRDVRQTLTPADREHFHRLLLEDAFPDSLKKIHRIRLSAIYEQLHKKKQAALCLSGGGIRSGTFALGVLQGLARHRLLDSFHYLSTVSGGGYIGSWLSAWIHRHKEGLKGVTRELANHAPPTKVDPDPPPIRYLRRYSSFLTPKVGLLSADSWTFIGIYLRNLLLNWIVLIPILLGLLTLPRLIVSSTIAPIRQDQALFILPTLLGDYSVYPRRMLLGLGIGLIVWALAYIMFNRPTVREELRQSSPVWRGRANQKWFQSCCLLPLLAGAFCLTTYWAWSSQNQRLPKEWYWFLIFGLGATFFAWLISSWVIGRFRLFSREFIYLLATGAVGGVLLWLVTYFVDPFRGGEMFDWRTVADWSMRTWSVEIYACLATPAFLLIVLLGATIYVGLSSVSPKIDDEDREWWARLGAWVLIVILAWTVFTTLVIFGPLALWSAPKLLGSLGTVSGILAAIAGRSAKTPATAKEPTNDSAKSSIFGLIISKGLPLLAAIFLAFLVIVLSVATTEICKALAFKWPAFVSRYTFYPLKVDQFLEYIYGSLGKEGWIENNLAHLSVLHLTSFKFVVTLGASLLLIGFVASLLINLNLFSLHAGYRNRLIRAFLGASRPDHERKPNPFTGFDPADNISMHELRPGLFGEDDFPRAVTLAKVLRKPRDPQVARDYPAGAQIAEYLTQRNLLSNLNSILNPDAYSLKLLAALRKDLNVALREESLEETFPALATAAKASQRKTGYLYLNRAIFEHAFNPGGAIPSLIKPWLLDEDYRLFPVVNTTLNLVGGTNLAWQQRKAEPFSVTPLYSGCFRLGYRDSRFYGGRDTGGISIGTAAAISGAAASSNMGYYTTSPVLSLVLTFFNVRLGWWLGNPGTAGQDTYDRRAPKSSVEPVIDEALGLTDDKNQYVYLTDGGHFDNLGLYEMVLRRCHVIVVSDAAADSEYRFGDLGNAIRKIRIDLGVPIEFTALPIFRSENEQCGKGLYWAVGKIRYSCIDENAKDGLLLYIKPTVYGREPRDVLEYKKSYPVFPHQSTADQFFDEPQFESYRVLGSYIMDQICGSGNEDLTLNQAISRAVAKLIADQNGASADPELKAWWDQWACECEK
jgi:Patatin-like phospholipase